MAGKSISFDIAALILLMILFISWYMRKMTEGVSNRLFIIIMGISIGATVFDIVAVTLDNAHSSHTDLLYTAHVGYLMAHYLSAPLHFLFVVSLTDTWHKLRRHFGLQFVLVAPVVIMEIVFVANAANGKIFTVENGYERGPLFWLIYVTTLFYLICDIIYIYTYRKLLSTGKILAISAVIPVGVTAMIVQMLEPHMLVEMFAGAVSLLIISISIQRPEDYVDTFTELMKFSAYVNDLKRDFYNDKHVTVIMINIGNYNVIQQLVGFDSATGLLKDIADKLRDINRRLHGYAEIYYLDNGRYRMVLYGKNRVRAEEIAAAVNDELKRNTDFNGLDINLLPFIALAQCPEEITTFRILMSFGADFHQRYPYTGKIMRASEVLDHRKMDIQSNIDAIIDRALENNSFMVYYQPIYSIAEKRFVSAEALIRLNDPEHGFISPEDLIVAAERNGTIHKIGEYVFETVCRFIASSEFKALGLDYIEVNLSVAQIMNGDLAESYLKIMEKYHVMPEQINLEITETAAAYAQNVMADNLNRLTKEGISFSLDDYGTGYSNMQRMIGLPLKIIKLDKSFVNEDNDPKIWAFLENTVKMIKDMDMEIVVEGVETREMLDMFVKMECDFIQGYFFSKPIPQSDFVAFIQQANTAKI